MTELRIRMIESLQLRGLSELPPRCCFLSVSFPPLIHIIVSLSLNLCLAVYQCPFLEWLLIREHQ